MRNCLLIPLLTCGLLVQVSCTLSPPPTAPDKTAQLPYGFAVSLGLFASDPRFDYSLFLDEIATTGATQINLVIPINQENIHQSTPLLGVPTETIQKTIQAAHARGFWISVMPLIKLKNRGGDDWRGRLAPKNETLWWKSYQFALKTVAQIANEHGVKMLFIGAELCSLENRQAAWFHIIKSLRAVFDGALTYSANWDHYADVPFWSALDLIAVTAYFPISHFSQLDSTWTNHIKAFDSVAASHKKPLLISEFGYPAIKTAMHFPWDETRSPDLNLDQQHKLIQAAVNRLRAQISMVTARHDDATGWSGRLRAAFLWNWFGYGGTDDPGFTLRRRGMPRIRLD